MKKQFVLGLFLILSSVYALNAEFYYDNGTIVKNMNYDKNFSYMDLSVENPNIVVKLWNNQTPLVGKYVWAGYASIDGNLSVPIQEIAAKITNWNSSCNCTYVDIDLSPFKAIYPGYVWVYIGNKPFSNITEYSNTSLLLNGSYSIFGFMEDNYFRILYISAFTNKNEKIEYDVPYLVITSYDRIANKVLDKKIARPNEEVHINASDNSNIYVNGLVGLKIRSFDGCGEINVSGYYYVLNNSQVNLNDTCIIVNTSDIAIDFKNNLIDANATNYSGNPCGVIINKVKNVILARARIQEFPYALCVDNSSKVYLIKTVVLGKNISLLLNTSEDVEAEEIITSTDVVKPKEWDVISYKGAYHYFKNLTTASTKEFFIKFRDIGIKYVNKTPEIPPPWTDIGQFIYLKNSTLNGEALFNFTIPTPPPKNLDLYTFHLFYTEYPDINDTWHFAFEKNYVEWPVTIVTNYSVVGTKEPINKFTTFAPFGKQSNETLQGSGASNNEAKPVGAVTVPQPVPKPTPKPTPEPEPTPPKIDLELEKTNFSVEQGATFEIPFIVKNVGEVDAENLVISALARKGWDVLNYTVSLATNTQEKGKIIVRVPENEIPDKYLLPVYVDYSGSKLDMELAIVRILPRNKIARLDILEMPKFIRIYPGDNFTLSIFVKNSGDVELHNISLTLRNADKCIKAIHNTYNLEPGKSKTLRYVLETYNKEKTCKNVIAVLTTKEGAIAFSEIEIDVTREVMAGINIPLIVIIFALWTLLLIAYYFMVR